MPQIHISFNIPNIFINVANSTVLYWFNSLISFHIFNSPTYSKVQQIKYFNLVYIISDSTFPYIQQSHKFSCIISFYILISFKGPTHSTVSQIQLSYLISRSYLIQHSQLIHQCSKSSHQCSKFNSHLIQQSHTFNSVTNSTVLSRFTFSSIQQSLYSTVYTIYSFII